MSLYKKLMAGAGVAVISAAAQATVIDDFLTPQSVTDTTANATAVTSSVVADPGTTILGGVRDISDSLITSTFGQGTSAATSQAGGVGFFNFNTGTGSTANALVQWDGTAGFAGAGPNGITPTGLGGADITSGGNLLGFRILTYNSDHPFQFEIAAYSSAANFSIIRFQAHTTPGVVDPPIESLIPFIGFAACGASGGDVISVTCGGTGVNFANLGALELRLFGTSDLDLTIGLISSVPEPGVLGLIGASMFGLAFARRRSRKQA